MTRANGTRLSLVREATFGTTPASARMRSERFTGESLSYVPKFTRSNEIRSDRNAPAMIKIGEETGGGLNFEWTYPEDGTALSERIASLMFNDWTNTPTFDNDGTADSVITDAGTTTDTYVVASGGAAVKAGHLVRATGFTNSANNQIFKAASSTSTTVVGSGLSLTAETAPPGTAKLKVVGFQGASGDVTALADGLGSTSLDFTTLGLSVGQWLKVGGSATGDKFGTAALNDWVRISGTITATKIPLDNLPSGWTTDSGTGKTIKVWFGDHIKNSTTRISHSTERAFLAQATPTYIVHHGMIADGLDLTIPTEEKITGSLTFLGLTSAQGTAEYGTTYDAVTTNEVMAGSVNVGRIAESGSTLTSPNWVKSLTIQARNNCYRIGAADSLGAVDIQPGDFEVTGTLESYFGDNSLLTKLLAGTTGSINARTAKNSQATIFQIPSATFTQGSPNAAQKNSDVMLPLGYGSNPDSTTSSSMLMDRLPYYE
jgi:hypothetical protein